MNSNLYLDHLTVMIVKNKRWVDGKCYGLHIWKTSTRYYFSSSNRRWPPKTRLWCKSFAVKDAIKELDDRLSRMFEKISKVKNLDEINIMLLSDHSQIDTAYPIRLNKMLADMNLVNVNEDGTVKKTGKHIS